jgi:hypothetical protein
MSEDRIALISGAADPIGRTIWAELLHDNEGSLGLEKGYPRGLTISVINSAFFRFQKPAI